MFRTHKLPVQFWLEAPFSGRLVLIGKIAVSKTEVESSNLSPPTIIASIVQLVERFRGMKEVTGSTPVGSSISAPIAQEVRALPL